MCPRTYHRVLQGAPPGGWGGQLCFTCPSAPDPFFKASKALFLTLKSCHPVRAPRQAPLELRCAQDMGGIAAKHVRCLKCPFQGGPGSVRFGYGLGMERFERFRLSVPAVPLRRGFFCVSAQFSREDGSGFGSWKTVPAVPVPRLVPGKTVPTVPVPVPVRFLGHPAFSN